MAGSYVLATGLAYALASLYVGGPALAPWRFYAWVAVLFGGCIVAVSLHRLWQWRDPGPAIAELLGARCVEPGRCTPTERKLLNVVEEMAIAARIRVPPVYMLDREYGVNALVAGYSPDEAVIIATAGLARELSRDELQGVMGHEYSHILNGDMALNVRLAAILGGLTWLRERGEALVYAMGEEMRQRPPEERGAGALAAVGGALLAFIGFPGTLAAEAIKAAIARERELLADAASVQFTRNPEGIAGALDTLLARRAHTTIGAAYASTLSHMFFAPAVASWWFATHPPLEERIRRVHPRFQRADYRARRHGDERREYVVFDDAGNVVRTIS